MRRVVVTGMGIVSSIGNNTQEVLAGLREGKSGIVRAIHREAAKDNPQHQSNEPQPAMTVISS